MTRIKALAQSLLKQAQKNVQDVDWNTIFYNAVPNLLLDQLEKYFRLEIEGAHHLPKRGAAIVIANHSGFSGFDAVMLIHEVYKNTGRIPRALAHWFWFTTKLTAYPMEKLGFLKATSDNGLNALKRNRMLMIFPEAEYGNFKPSAQAYQMQNFKTGFVRMALLEQCPIIPVIILGAEETHINLKQFKLSPKLKSMIIPLPLNLLPLPAKWKMVVLPPIVYPFDASRADDTDLLNELAGEMRDRMQAAIQEELSKRQSVF